MIKRAWLEGEGMNVIDLMVTVPNFFPTRAEAKKSIMSGGFLMNGIKINSIDFHVTEKDFIQVMDQQRFMICQKGKKNIFVIELENELTKQVDGV